jgi:acetyltransferase-like isoleucine patch superfamily enzyme
MAAFVSSTLQFLIRVKDGLASRARNIYYKALGVEIHGYCWLQKIEIRRNHSEISLAKGVALDHGVILLCSGPGTGKKKITIGENTYINRNSFIDASQEIRIGRNVGIGPRCYITDHDHGTAPGELIMAQPLIGDTTTICDNVWLGASVIVLQGVTIGPNTIVAAGSVVARDLPPDVLAEGRPARPFKKRK